MSLVDERHDVLQSLCFLPEVARRPYELLKIPWRPNPVRTQLARRAQVHHGTFAVIHEVFCVRIALTITAIGVSAGHQCCGPQLRDSLW